MINHNFDHLTWLTARPVPASAKVESLVIFEAFIDWCTVQDYSFKVKLQLLKVLLLHVYALRTTSTADQCSKVLLTAIGTW